MGPVSSPETSFWLPEWGKELGTVKLFTSKSSFEADYSYALLHGISAGVTEWTVNIVFWKEQ